MAKTENKGRLSTNIRRMVDKETEEFTDSAMDIKNTIDGAIKLATGIDDLTELYKEAENQTADTTAGSMKVSMLDPKGIQAVLKAEHLEAVRSANYDSSAMTSDRKIGLYLSKSKKLLAALSAIDSDESSSLL